VALHLLVDPQRNVRGGLSCFWCCTVCENWMDAIGCHSSVLRHCIWSGGKGCDVQNSELALLEVVDMGVASHANSEFRTSEPVAIVKGNHDEVVEYGSGSHVVGGHGW
jgi:hypothetical protein